jgi:dTDP-4-amino-4,6-dideoxygalactose transaminase
MSVPFIDLKAQYLKIKDEIDKAVLKVLDHGKYIMGPEVEELEKKLADYAGVKHCISVSSGTDALHAALLSKDLKKNDAVIAPSFTFIASGEAITFAGGTPVFSEIDPKTFNIQVKNIEEAVEFAKKNGLNPVGVITVDLFGQPCDYDEINQYAKENGLWVIDDAAQSFGGEYKNKKVGALTEISTTSFYPAKPFGAYGDGGALFTNDDQIANVLRSIKIYGYDGLDKYNNLRQGLNARLDTIQAAVLLEKLKIFDWEIEKRQEIADTYTKELESTVEVPFVKSYNKSAWAQYTVKVDDKKRDKVREILKENDIPTACFYPRGLHVQKVFEKLNSPFRDLPITEKLSDQVFSIPFHPYLKEKDQMRIIEEIKKTV